MLPHPPPPKELRHLTPPLPKWNSYLCEKLHLLWEPLSPSTHFLVSERLENVNDVFLLWILVLLLHTWFDVVGGLLTNAVLQELALTDAISFDREGKDLYFMIICGHDPRKLESSLEFLGVTLSLPGWKTFLYQPRQFFFESDSFSHFSHFAKKRNFSSLSILLVVQNFLFIFAFYFFFRLLNFMNTQLVSKYLSSTGILFCVFLKYLLDISLFIFDLIEFLNFQNSF